MQLIISVTPISRLIATAACDLCCFGHVCERDSASTGKNRRLPPPGLPDSGRESADYAVSALGVMSSVLNLRDFDGGDEGHVAVNFGEAFGQDADCGQVVFLELVGQVAEPPAEHHHVSGGEREGQFLRRQIFVVLSIRVWLQRVLNQLAGVEATAFVFSRVELDAGAILARRGITGIFFEGHRC